MQEEPADFTDELLWAICRIPSGSDALSPDLAADLRAVPALAARASSAAGPELQYAAVLVAAALGRLPQHQLTHLPFGYEGPSIRSAGWIDEETLQTVTKQIVGLAWPETPADVTAAAVDAAVGNALHLAFLERRKYDAWRPGMRTGSGWRFAVAATPYGARVARRHARVPAPPPETNPKPARPETQRPVPARAPGPWFYLYADAGTPSVLGEATVFFRTDDEEVAITICRLLGRKPAGRRDEAVRFFVKPATDLRLDEQLILDEAIERLAADGDRRAAAKYPPPPPLEGDPPDRAALFAKAWELAERLEHRVRERTRHVHLPKPNGAAEPPPRLPELPHDPLRVWLASETMKVICHRLLFHSVMMRADKDSEYDDRDVMSRDARLAESNGYLVVSVARQLGLNAGAMIRVLREDRLWEYPVEDGDPGVFRNAADVAERVSVEARIWCAETGVDPKAYLDANDVEAAERRKASEDREPSKGPAPAEAVVNTVADAPKGATHKSSVAAAAVTVPPPATSDGLQPFHLRAWSQAQEALRRHPELLGQPPEALYEAAARLARAAGDSIVKAETFLRYYRHAKRYFANPLSPELRNRAEGSAEG